VEVIIHQLLQIILIKWFSLIWIKVFPFDVEWATMEEPFHLIGNFEKIVNNAANHISFPLICAYGEWKVPSVLETTLHETHPYILKDDKLISSKKYITDTPFYEKDDN
jgi:hypothetical protein